MERTLRGVVVCLALSGCSSTGEWVVQTWGEAYIEQEIPADVFADGCAVTYDAFEVSTTAVQLVDGDGTVVGELPSAVYDLTEPGPVPMGRVAVPADHYSDVQLIVAPDDAGSSVRVDGTLACGGDQAHFAWAFDPSTTYACEPTDLTVPPGGEDTTEITIHGDHLWYDGLEAADAEVRGRAVLDADTDGDGEITLEELDAVSIPALGYTVGEYSDVLTLRQFVSHLSRTIGHVDGEGECRVAF
ncbi:MAG: hypothetical protein R3F59_05200 [Myxococcota bacterium]